MDSQTLLLFALTVLPLVCTPGPDILFVTSQALAGGATAGLRATGGIVLGYSMHSLAVAFGLAAVVAASPLVFETIRWAGIVYLTYIAAKLLRSALKAGSLSVAPGRAQGQFLKGFLTSLMNPKGMMVYVAILPQFMDPHAGNSALQAVILSLAFMFCCVLVYGGLALATARVGGGSLSDARRRVVDGTAAGMILVAAGFVALAHP